MDPGRVDRVDPQLSEADDRGDDVDYRVESPEFVKMNLLDCLPVDPGFDASEVPEDLRGPGLDVDVERASLDYVHELGGRPLGFPLVGLDAELRTGDPVPLGPRGRHFVAGDTELPQLGLQVTELKPGVEERADDHVASHAGEAVKIRDSHSTSRIRLTTLAK